MNEAKKILDNWLLECNFKTYKELADFLGVAQNTLDVWKQRGKIPEKNILKYMYLSKNKNNTIAVGDNNITISGDNNKINSQNGDGLDTALMREFLELYKKYGNETILSKFIEKLKKLKELSES